MVYSLLIVVGTVRIAQHSVIVRHVLVHTDERSLATPHFPALMGNCRVCTENAMFCVPEAALGLGLAGGLSHVLPRLLEGNRPLGLCLALTGMALEGADLHSAQLATNYMVNGMFKPFIARLGEVR